MLVWFVLCASLTATFGRGSNPYNVLGVSRNTPAKEIQKRYRKLCLQYHPDKNVNKSTKERERCERKFKQVQEAYDMVQNPRPTFGGFQGHQHAYAQRGAANNSFGGSPAAEAFFNAFAGNGFGGNNDNKFFFYRTGPGGPAFGVRTPFPQRGSFSAIPAHMQAFKSVYVQKVKVPLEDLYKGIHSFRFQLHDNIFTRYQAAVRGKSIYLSLMLSSYVSIPIVRVSKLLAAVIGIYTMHNTLPRPDPQASYVTSLRKGTRGGKTNVKFSSASNDQPEIIFAIEEEKHPIYRRDDDNLQAEVTITSEQAKTGCTVEIDALDPNEKPVRIVIPRKRYSYKKQQEQKKKGWSSTTYNNVITIRGRGWPIKTPHHSDDHPDVYLYGDLLVTVKVLKPSSERREEKR